MKYFTTILVLLAVSVMGQTTTGNSLSDDQLKELFDWTDFDSFYTNQDSLNDTAPQSWTFHFSDTLHTIRFHGIIIIGGDVELEYSDPRFNAAEYAFEEWFQNLTIKEIREKYGFDIFRMNVIKEEER